MKKDIEYFDKKEQENFDKLVEFNDNILHLELMGQTPRRHHTDASGYTSTSRYFNIELKERNQELRQKDDGTYYIHGITNNNKEYTCNGIYIEQHKVCSMMLDYICNGYEPIYINFLNNCIIVYNLAKLKTRPNTDLAKKIKSSGYGAFEIGSREDLSLKDATIYDYNYNLIKRPE